MNTQTEEITESMTAEETAAPDYGTNRASYQPEDDKLRLYVGRVPRSEYEALRAEGWTSTPKQDCDFVAVWTPQREATAIRYAGIIEDEDMSPEERAADRAERFAGYRDRRTMEAVGHADRYDSGPAVHGYQDYGRAVKAADRHDRIAGRAVNSWDKAEYWQMRTAGVISHALHKCSPGVRMGRINTLEAELRKIEASGRKYCEERATEHGVILSIVEHSEGKRDKMKPAPGFQYCVARIREVDGQAFDAPFSVEQMRRVMISAILCGSRSDHWSERRGQVERGEMEAVTVAREWLDAHGWEAPEEYDPTGNAWHTHITLRLAYERQMLEAQGGRAEMLEILPGGKIAGRLIIKVNKSAVTKRAKSCVVLAPKIYDYDYQAKNIPGTEFAARTVELERLRPETYAAPTAESLAELEAWNKAQKAAAPKSDKAPLINPTDEDAERLQSLWNAQALADREAGYARMGYSLPVTDCKPVEVMRTTQAVYSANSKGTYSGAGTSLVFPGGHREESYYNAAEKMRKKHGKEVCQVRQTSSGGSTYSAARVIIITDKPQKPLPAAVWEPSLVADLATA